MYKIIFFISQIPVIFLTNLNYCKKRLLQPICLLKTKAGQKYDPDKQYL